jgi:hypothetical protein
MAESLASPLSRWKTGMHPSATGMRISSLGRVFLPLGEALRLEMTDDTPGAENLVHLQYYVITDAGPWAIWLSCAQTDVADSEASLRELTPPFAEEMLS